MDRYGARRIAVGGIVVTGALVLAACSTDGTSTVRHLDALDSLTYTEEWRIGSVTDPDLGFSQIRQVEVSESGEVYVIEGQAREVRVFSAEGERLRVLGGRGEGPGEFTSPTSMGFLGDTLWVTDFSARRMTWFGPDGRVLFMTPGQGIRFDPGIEGLSVTLTPSRPRSDGLIESTRGSMSMRLGAELRPFDYPVLLFDRNGEVVDTLRWERDEMARNTTPIGGMSINVPSLAPTQPVRSSFADGAALMNWTVSEDGSIGTLEVVRTGEPTDTLFVERLAYNPIPVPESVTDSLISGSLALSAALNLSEGEVASAFRGAIRLPSHRAPIRIAHAGADGTLWIQLNTPSVDRLDWVIVSPEGSVLGRLALPLKTRLAYSDYPLVWAIQADDYDVPWLVKLRVD